MAKKKDEIIEDGVDEEIEIASRVNRDFGREDLNDLRDAINELHADRG